MAGPNFDELLTKDRTFVVRGQTFTWQDVRPEVLDSILGAIGVTANGDGEKGGEQPDLWAQQDKLIMEFLVEEDRERWQNLRQRESEPITIRQFNAILEHLVSEQTDRPTPTPSPSARGRGKQGAT